MGCMSDSQKRELLSALDEYDKAADSNREKFLNGEKPFMIPVIQINFGWEVARSLEKR